MPEKQAALLELEGGGGAHKARLAVAMAAAPLREIQEQGNRAQRAELGALELRGVLSQQECRSCQAGR